MTKLTLRGLAVNSQNEKEAQTYIVDESKKSKQDGEIPTDFINYLEKVVVPQLKTTLLKSSYEVGMVACDQGSAPFITLARKDKNTLVDGDLVAMKSYITRAIQLLGNTKKLTKLGIHTSAEQKEIKKENSLKNIRSLHGA